MEPHIAVSMEEVSKKFCLSLRRSMRYGLEDFLSEALGLSVGSERLRQGEFWAVDNVSVDVRRGECLGLVGPNGAGKSTLLKLLHGIVMPDRGRVSVRGRVGALIELGIGFHPLMTGRENIFLGASILGMSKRETRARFDAIVDFSGIEGFLDMPVRSYSSGMYARLGFAIAAHINPTVLLVDEVLAVGDVAFQIRCFKHILRLKEAGTAIIFVSHNQTQVGRVADRCLLLHGGKCAALGPPADVFHQYSMLRREKVLFKELVIPHLSDFDDGSVRLLRGFADAPAEDKGHVALMGDPLRVSMTYEAVVPRADVRIELRFWNSSEELVGVLDSRDEGWCYSVKRGLGAVRVEIEHLALTPDLYRVAGGLLVGEDHLAWSPSLLYLDVRSPTHRNHPGFVFMKGQYSANEAVSPVDCSARAC